jgi:hypothetical protein
LNQKLTLETAGDGVAEELFQQALARVLTNIDDPNTEANAKRSITLTMSFEPSDDRRGSKVHIQCAMKLAGAKPVGTYIGIGRDNGQLAAVEALRQEEMFPIPVGAPRLAEGNS